MADPSDPERRKARSGVALGAGGEPGLVRRLSLIDTTSLVVGTVIGTGVFIKAAVMAQEAGTPALVLAAWVAAGLLSLAGALTYAELGAMLPHAGGEYVYLREAYGPSVAFLFGWMRFVVGSSGSIAILGVGAATFLGALFPLDAVWARAEFTLLGQVINWQFGVTQVVAVGAILLFTAANSLSVVVGGRIQSLLTALKLAGVVAVIVGVFFFSRTASWAHLAPPPGTPSWSGLAAFGTAMLAALWAYDGWSNMPMCAGEVRDPGRALPRALILGMVLVMVTYCLANLAYFYALDFETVRTSHSTQFRQELPVATKAAQTAFGENAIRLISLAFVISALGALNGSILTGARVTYAMARDGLFPNAAGRIHQRARVPVVALVIQAAWSCLLAVSGTFDQLTDYVVFALWIFYGLVTSAVFVLRRKLPNASRPYRTLGYPVVPILFVAVAVWLVVNTLFSRPVESLAGLILIALGLPLRYFWGRKRDALR